MLDIVNLIIILLIFFLVLYFIINKNKEDFISTSIPPSKILTTVSVPTKPKCTIKEINTLVKTNYKNKQVFINNNLLYFIKSNDTQENLENKLIYEINEDDSISTKKIYEIKVDKTHTINIIHSHEKKIYILGNDIAKPENTPNIYIYMKILIGLNLQTLLV